MWLLVRAFWPSWMPCLLTLALAASCSFDPISSGAPGDAQARPDAARDRPDASIPDPGVRDAGERDARVPDAAPDADDGIDLERDLVGYWPLDTIASDTPSDITPDVSGNDFDGVVSGTSLVTGRVGMALRFDGNDDFVRIGDPSALDISGAITLSAWCRPGSLDGSIRNIVVHGSTLNPNREVFLRLHTDNNGQYEGGSWDGTDHKAIFTVPGDDVDMGWVHLATVYDGSDWILYRNGTEVSRRRDSVGALTVDETWVIGARLEGSPDRVFRGDIDDVRIYARALSAAEVAALATP